MRFRVGLGFVGVVLVILGSGFLVAARSYADLADRLAAHGEASVVPAQVHLAGSTSKNGDQHLSVDAVRVADPGSGASAPTADSGAGDPGDPEDGPWTAGWVPLTGVDQVGGLPYDVALDNRWVPARPAYGYSSPLHVRFVDESDGSTQLMADSDIRRWRGPEETTDAAAMLVAGVLVLLGVVLVVRRDARRERGRQAALETRRLALYGPQDAVLSAPQDAPLTRRERGRRRDHVGRHRAPAGESGAR